MAASLPTFSITAGEDARLFVEGMTKQDFLTDRRTQQAVVMSLVIIGEAAGRIMDQHLDFIAAHPAIPRRSMRGMRNRIARGYFEVNLDVVWETLQTALPDLSRQLEHLRGDKSGT